MFIGGFQTSQNAGNISTLALGEEGGTVTTFAIGEEGGTVTTFALGEEGGITSQPFDEEGGASPASRRTQDYLNFMFIADGGFSGDGKITKDELNDQLEEYADRLAAIERIEDRFPFFGPVFGQLKQALQSQIRVGSRLVNNFSVLAEAIKDPNSITYRELFKVAFRDGNPYTLTDFDLLNPQLSLFGE